MDNAPPKLRFAWKPLLMQSQIVGMLALAQFALNAWTNQKPDPASPDKLVLFALLFAGVNFAVMFAGDWLARRKGLWRRSHYMALGAVAATAAHAVALAPAAYVQAAREGILFALVLVPPLIGAVTAFLMHLSLGYAAEGDDPQALARSAGNGADSAVHDTGLAEYYEGPLQVRSSPMAAVLASLAGSALYVFVTLVGLSDGFLPADAMPPLFRHNPVLFALYGICGCALPFYVMVMRSHSFLQRRAKVELKSYALAGVVVPGGFALALIALMGPMGFIFVLPWVLPAVVAMSVYHRFAGFEPLDIPADIEVRDPRAMLPADHIRRRVRRVVRAD
jgi:hypothetical protein